MHDAKLVWITPEAEKLIGKIARVSNPKNEDNPNVEGLLKYLIKHKHWSPFEMASMCVEIQTTRAISPQILRHRSFSFQEFSQRYAPAMGLDFHIYVVRTQQIDKTPSMTWKMRHKATTTIVLKLTSKKQKNSMSLCCTQV